MEKQNISNILFDLLKEHNRVSVPCLGSFVAQPHAAVIAEDRRSLLPPFKAISFNPQEIWNDERLERELARRTGCSTAEAREQVAFWVDDLCFTLATERHVRLESLGVLSISDSNQVSFSLDQGLNLLKDSFGLTPVEVKQIPAMVLEQPEEAQPKMKRRSYAWLIFTLLLLAIIAVLLYFYAR